MGSAIAVALRILLERSRAEAAAVVAGALLDGCFASMTMLVRASGTLPDDALEGVRLALPPALYDEARQRGAAMTYEQILAFVLAELDPSPPPS